MLLGAFVYVESRAADPLVPLRLFRVRGLSVSALALALNGGAFLGMFFMTALYLQQVHGDSALDAGAHFVPMGIAAIALRGRGRAARHARRHPRGLPGRLGDRRRRAAPAQPRRRRRRLRHRHAARACVVFGLGLPLVGVANQIAAVAEVPHEDAGAASGIVTAAFQVGGAIGLALVSTAATSRVSDAVAAGVAQPEALAQGFERGLLVAAGLAVANLVVGVVRAPRIKPDAALVAEATAG